jgi:hypothetical protein
VGADPTDIDIHSVRAPAYLWCPMVPYYSIWSVEPDEEGKGIKMVISIKTQMFFSVRGVGASHVAPCIQFLWSKFRGGPRHLTL